MSEVKVNKLSPRSGTTVTIGDSGDTVNIVGTLQNNGAAIPGDISSVVAGTGLSGGGTSGDVTLNVEAAQSGITSLGTITGFTSTGIDDNATSTAITIDSSENVGIKTASPGTGLQVNQDWVGNYGSINVSHSTNSLGGLGIRCNDVFKAALIYRGGTTGALLDLGTYETEPIIFRTANSEKMRITSDGDVGIGLTSPAHKLSVFDGSLGIVARFATTGNRSLDISSADNGIYAGAHWNRNVNSAGGIQSFSTEGNENMRISSTGIVFNESSQDLDFRVESNNVTDTLFVDGGNDAVIFGDDSNITPAESSTAAHACIPSNGRMQISASSYPCLTTNRVNSEGITIEFRQAGGVKGSISVGGSSTAFNTSSDYRLKENVSYDFDATTKLKQLKPARFNWISDETNTLVDGFIAHEVSDIIPEAIIGTKDAVDENGNIKPQGIDQSKLVPLLVKTIQELEARITELENA